MYLTLVDQQKEIFQYITHVHFYNVSVVVIPGIDSNEYICRSD